MQIVSKVRLFRCYFFRRAFVCDVIEWRILATSRGWGLAGQRVTCDRGNRRGFEAGTRGLVTQPQYRTWTFAARIGISNICIVPPTPPRAPTPPPGAPLTSFETQFIRLLLVFRSGHDYMLVVYLTTSRYINAPSTALQPSVTATESGVRTRAPGEADADWVLTDPWARGRAGARRAAACWCCCSKRRWNNRHVRCTLRKPFTKHTSSILIQWVGPTFSNSNNLFQIYIHIG